MRLLATLVLVLAGCNYYSPEGALKADVGYPVPLYYKGGARPAAPYEVIGTCKALVSNSSQGQADPREESVRAALRIKARKLKADALIDVEIVPSNRMNMGIAMRSGEGEAIRYK